MSSIDIICSQNRYYLIDNNEKYEYSYGDILCEGSRIDLASIKEYVEKFLTFYNSIEPYMAEQCINDLKIELLKDFHPFTALYIYSIISAPVLFWRFKHSIEITKFKKDVSNKKIEAYVKPKDIEHIGYSKLKNLIMDFTEKAFNEHQIDSLKFSAAIDFISNNANDLSLHELLGVKYNYSNSLNVRMNLNRNNIELEYSFREDEIESLILLEIINCKDVTFKRCKNCGNYFIQNESYTDYCNYTSPKNRHTSCNELHNRELQEAKSNLEHIAKEYRKTYTKYKMRIKRNPSVQKSKDKLNELIEGNKQWQAKIKDNPDFNYSQDYLKWLSRF